VEKTMKNNYQAIEFILIIGIIGCVMTGCIFFVEESADITPFVNQLAALNGGTDASNPVRIKPAAMTFTTKDSTPLSFIHWNAMNDAVRNAQKYIILDLSDCTAEGSRIDGRDTYEHNYNGMNIIQYNPYIKSIILPSNLKTIGNAAFANCGYLTSVVIPNRVTSIENAAFSGCDNLTDIAIPSSVTFIGDNVFSYCYSLTNIAVDAANSVYTNENGVLFNKGKTILIRYPVGRQGTSYIIPGSVTSIQKDAFRGCDSLTGVTIPASVTSIEAGAFAACTGLIEMTIPGNVVSIGENAFWACNNLTDITIPASITSIGEGAFGACSGLTRVTFEGSGIEIGNMVFDSTALGNAYKTGGAGTYTRTIGQQNWEKK
jgi:hypothetical protein